MNSMGRKTSEEATSGEGKARQVVNWYKLNDCLGAGCLISGQIKQLKRDKEIH